MDGDRPIGYHPTEKQPESLLSLRLLMIMFVDDYVDDYTDVSRLLKTLKWKRDVGVASPTRNFIPSLRPNTVGYDYK
jgi:hypothetical protein